MGAQGSAEGFNNGNGCAIRCGLVRLVEVPANAARCAACFRQQALVIPVVAAAVLFIAVALLMPPLGVIGVALHH